MFSCVRMCVCQAHVEFASSTLFFFFYVFLQLFFFQVFLFPLSEHEDPTVDPAGFPFIKYIEFKSPA